MEASERGFILIIVSIDDLSKENRIRITKALRRHLRLGLHESLQIMDTLDQLPRVIRTGFGSIHWNECEERLAPLIEELGNYGVIAKMKYDDGSQD